MVPSKEGHQDPRNDDVSLSLPVREIGQASFMLSPKPDPCPSEAGAPLSIDACVGTALIGRASVPHTAIGSATPGERTMNAQLTSTALQVFLPFVLAGFGSTLAGILLDVVKDWPVYVIVHHIFVVIPPLLGLSGNLEQTLVARLSTQVPVTHRYLRYRAYHYLYLKRNGAPVIDSFCQCGRWSCRFVMSTVVVLSTKCEKNPDNIAPAIAASFGDLTTLFLLSGYSSLMLYHPWPHLTGIMTTDFEKYNEAPKSGFIPTTCESAAECPSDKYTLASGGVRISEALCYDTLNNYNWALTRASATSKIMPEKPTLTRLVKVLVLLYLARLIVYHLWNWGVDPDNAAIPCLTGCGDFLGTGFLTMAYALLNYMGDKSAVQEEELRSYVHVTTHLTAHASSSTPSYGNSTLS
ncbi:solute carrier family 41 member 1-like [Rhipicephalus microplus]|uniref:solute carrier family 41 member 1-like n=1 Tax=Rhipicephalus microplus TaxID=6941 RepID=UPI003F6C0940